MKPLEQELDVEGISKYFQVEIPKVILIIEYCRLYPNQLNRIITELKKIYITLKANDILVLGYVLGLIVATHECNEQIINSLKICQRQN